MKKKLRYALAWVFVRPYRRAFLKMERTEESSHKTKKVLDERNPLR